MGLTHSSFPAAETEPLSAAKTGTRSAAATRTRSAAETIAIENASEHVCREGYVALVHPFGETYNPVAAYIPVRPARRANQVSGRTCDFTIYFFGALQPPN